MGEFSPPRGSPAELRQLLAGYAFRAVAEYLLERVGVGETARHVQVQLTFQDGALRRTDLHIGPLRAESELGGRGVA
jgi:hypothetical protein